MIAFEEKRFADAEERYGELVVLKRAMIDEDGLAEALEWQGLSQERQLAYDRAVGCWYESALICKAFEMTDRLTAVLDHLRRGYQALDMRRGTRTNSTRNGRVRAAAMSDAWRSATLTSPIFGIRRTTLFNKVMQETARPTETARTDRPGHTEPKLHRPTPKQAIAAGTADRRNEPPPLSAFELRRRAQAGSASR